MSRQPENYRGGEANKARLAGLVGVAALAFFAGAGTNKNASAAPTTPKEIIQSSNFALEHRVIDVLNKMAQKKHAGLDIRSIGHALGRPAVEIILTVKENPISVLYDRIVLVENGSLTADGIVKNPSDPLEILTVHGTHTERYPLKGGDRNVLDWSRISPDGVGSFALSEQAYSDKTALNIQVTPQGAYTIPSNQPLGATAYSDVSIMFNDVVDDAINMTEQFKSVNTTHPPTNPLIA